ncbi:MAG TPA: hypothetical protein PLI59_20915 [Candidatus Obscuribacter sp.]|nr:hypothetical protein [Candidatus Obscuribacter sp.]
MIQSRLTGSRKSLPKGAKMVLEALNISLAAVRASSTILPQITSQRRQNGAGSPHGRQRNVVG